VRLRQVVSEQKKESLLSIAEKKENFTMPPRRRDRQSPDSGEEREMPRGRGRQVQNPDMEREVHNLRARMEDMETSQRRKADAGDISESENEDDVGHGEEEIPAGRCSK
jgi:hypothetical protein